jgi:hypothetical protein
MSKRVKVNFETINKGKYKVIPWEKIHETNKLIKEAMRKLRGKFKSGSRKQSGGGMKSKTSPSHSSWIILG